MSEFNQTELYVDALKEIYRRDFRKFAGEQLYIRAAVPGGVCTLDFGNPSAISYNPIQKIVDDAWEEQLRTQGYIRLVIIKPRQPGMSTYTQARCFHKTIFTRNFSTLLLALDEDSTRSIFEMSRFYYDNIDPRIKPMIRYSTKKELVFENPDDDTRSRYPGLSSRMNFQSSSRVQVGTGTTRHAIHISEASKFDSNVTTHLEASLMPTLHRFPGTVLVNESTAFVGGEWFRGACDRARSERSDYRLVFIPWYMHPEYRLPLDKNERMKLDKEEQFLIKLAKKGQPEDRVPPMDISFEQLKWRRMVRANLHDPASFDQEYPYSYESAWVTYDVNVFDRRKLYAMREHLCQPQRFVKIMPDGKIQTVDNQRMDEDGKGYCAIWKEPEKDRKYDIGVDTSAGVDGGDWTVAEVMDRYTKEQVAEYRFRIDGFALADEINVLGHYYNTAQIGIEMANTGFAVNAGLQRHGYPYLYIWRHRERAYPTLSTYTGWKTQRDSKGYMITAMISWFLTDKFKIHSQVLWNEMYNYIRMPGGDDYYDRYRAAIGHDDAVMAWGISLIISDDETSGLVLSKPKEAVDRQSIIERNIANGPWASDDEDFKPRKARRELEGDNW